MPKIHVSFLLLLVCVSVGVYAATVDESQWPRDEHGCRVYNPTAHPKPGETIRWSGSCTQGYAEGSGRVEWFDVGGKSDGWAQGNFEHGYLQGFGEAQHPKGTHYSGEFRYSQPNGRGKLLFDDGTQCEGLFRDGYQEGLGTIVWPDGKRYEGEFQHSKRNGHGTFIGASGLRVEGTYREGHVEGRATVTWPSGTSYHVEIWSGSCVGLSDWRPAAADLQQCKDRGDNGCKAALSAVANAIGCLPGSVEK
jgi:hypothetical protein